MKVDWSTIDLEGILQRLYDAMTPLQRPAVGKARTGERVLFNMWPGTGKTLAALASGIIHRPSTWLIVGYKRSEAAGWMTQLEEWIPEIPLSSFRIVKGQQSERLETYRKPALFYFTTMGSLLRDIDWLLEHKVRFNVITPDEIHRYGLRNHKSGGFRTLERLLLHCEKNGSLKLFNPLTGTWTSKSVPQQFPFLHLANRRVFSSYWRFVETYNHIVQGQWGKEIIGPKNTEGLAIVTSPYVYTVDEKTASKHLPPLTRSRIKVELSDNQRLHYDTMLKEMFIDTGEDIHTVSTLLGKITRLRQLVCCPAIINPTLGVGDLIEYVADKIEESDRPGWRHNLIFTPFIPAIPAYRDYLASRWSISKDHFLLVQGGMEANDLKTVETVFRRNRETCIIASISASQSWNAETALNVYFPHFDWDQDMNKQAEARARRTDGVQKHITAYYYDVRGTITNDIINALNDKEEVNLRSMEYMIKLANKLQEAARSKDSFSPPLENS